MKNVKHTKRLLIAAAVTGALVGLPLAAQATPSSPNPGSGPKTEKQGCGGKEGCGGKDGGGAKSKEKAGCGAKEAKGQKPATDKGGDKVACAGKDGCGAKDARK